jgi:peptidyl-dipeptidase Dcp
MPLQTSCPASAEAAPVFAFFVSALLALGLTAVPGRADAQSSPSSAAPAAAKDAPAHVPYDFAKPSALPFEYPPFDRLQASDYAAGFDAGIAQENAQIAAIAQNAEAPTFENTIVAMERAGQTLKRVNEWFNEQSTSNTNDDLDKLQLEVAPKLAAHQDSIYLDPQLFARVKTVFDKRDSLQLDAESARLLDRYHTLFVRAGAQLSPHDKEKLKALNQELSTLQPQFTQALLKATNDGGVLVDRVGELDGATPERVAAAAEAAKARGHEGKWLVTLENTTRQSILGEITNRALRERIFQASVHRGVGGPDDTTAIVAHMARLRAQQARLLGYPDYAAYVLADAGAKNPATVNKTLHDMSVVAQANARKFAQELQREIDADAKARHVKSFALAPWDWEYYSGRLRKARFDFDEKDAAPYFELERVLKDGVFFAANQLYGLSFSESHDLPVYQKGVRTFDVFDADGSPLGILILDYFARPNKQGGAWMSNYIDQNGMFHRSAVVVNNLNIRKPPEGQPVLLSFSEVTTMFHEFGHAMHGILSHVQYPLLSGTNTAIDFVEYPSQYNEMWATDPRVLANYARHYQSGAAMPKAMLDKLLAMDKYNQVFDTTEYLSASQLDQAWHQIAPDKAPDAAHVMAFEGAALHKDGIDFAPVPPRYHTTYFAHIWGNSYSAAYYAYIWAAVLAADTKEWMRSHGGLNRANGDFLRAKVLSRGGTADAASLFHDFYGSGPDVEPLLQERGLSEKSKAKPH